MMGGFLAPELKHAGYDKVIIRGKSPDLVYLWIHNDKVEIRDATHLRGKGAIETARAHPRGAEGAERPGGGHRPGRREPGLLRLDRAGPTRAPAAAASAPSWATRGSRRSSCAAPRTSTSPDPAEFIDLCDDVLKYIKIRDRHPIPGVLPILAGLGSPQEMTIVDEEWHTTNFMWGNARTRRKDFWTKEIEEKWRETQENVRTRLISCYNCPMKCGATISVPGPADLHDEVLLASSPTPWRPIRTWTSASRSRSTPPNTASTASRRRRSWPSRSSCYEAGILTDADFPGMPADTEGRFFWLLDKIVRREGIGDVLADGIYWAARRIGKGAEKPTTTTRSRSTSSCRSSSACSTPVYFLMYATGEKINITQIEGQFPQAPFPTTEEREAFVKDWIQVPDDKFKQYVLDWEPRGEKSNPYYPTVEASCEIVDWQEKMHYIDDALGICAGLSSFPLEAAVSHPQLPGLHLGGDRASTSTRRACGRPPRATAPCCAPSTCGGACGAPTRSRRRTTGRSASPSSRRSCWTSTTSSRAGTATAFRPRRRWTRLAYVADDLEHGGSWARPVLAARDRGSRRARVRGTSHD